jgi:SAM-dependent methyltransferase
MIGNVVIWHDVECGHYILDLPLWRELARAQGGPVLDVGAGTGRVSLGLAAAGYEVVATDLDAELIAALEERAAEAGLDRLTTVVGDARTLDLGGATFPLILVPMQTVQLFDGRDGRLAFLRAAKAHLRPGGVLALALADAMDAFEEDEEYSVLPVPDMREIDGVVYASRPVAIRDLGAAGASLERLREVVMPDGSHASEPDSIRLDLLDADTLEAEAREVCLTVLPRREVPATDEYVGSAVVMLGA